MPSSSYTGASKRINTARTRTNASFISFSCLEIFLIFISYPYRAMHSIGHKLIRKSFFLPRPATDRKPEADTDTESERNIMQQQNAERHTQAKSDTESVTQRTIGRRYLLTILLKRLFLFIRYALMLFAVQIRTSR